MKSGKVWECREDAPEFKIQERGTGALTDMELLGILLGGTPEDVQKARNLVSMLGSLQDISRASISELEMCGLTNQQAKIVVASFEVSRRKLADDNRRVRFQSAASISSYLIPKYGDMKTEAFGVIFLNKGNEVLKEEILFQGGVSHVNVDSKVIFQKAVNYLASAIVVFHNHPSGRVMPSDADDALTQHLVNVSKIMDIPVLEHVILGKSRFYSYAEMGLIKIMQDKAA